MSQDLFVICCLARCSIYVKACPVFCKQPQRDLSQFVANGDPDLSAHISSACLASGIRDSIKNQPGNKDPGEDPNHLCDLFESNIAFKDHV